ncbi:hypothetical protein, partial [uncultured Nostoc sp.]|uniref:hypothetical protein n=1 Tax=uncultured Nostoc sp. TaxID=340711 RepID=UPI0035CA124E
AVNARLRNFGQYIVKNLSSGCYGDSDVYDGLRLRKRYTVNLKISKRRLSIIDFVIKVMPEGKLKLPDEICLLIFLNTFDNDANFITTSQS